MKNSSFENLKQFEILTSKTKVIIGGGPLEDCKATAKRDGNDWLIPVCDEVLGGN